jgi:hypothetical protein
LNPLNFKTQRWLVGAECENLAGLLRGDPSGSESLSEVHWIIYFDIEADVPHYIMFTAM